MAPAGYTRASPASSARCRTSRVTSAESFTGRVLGIATTEVKPPATAALRPGEDGLLPLLARLAEVHVEVDEAGGDPQALGRHLLGALQRQGLVGDRRHLAVLEADVADPVHAGSGGR